LGCLRPLDLTSAQKPGVLADAGFPENAYPYMERGLLVFDLLSLAASAFIVGFSGAMAPGPLTAMTVAESARRGFRAGPLLTLGHAIAEVIIVIALALGLSRLFQHALVSGAIALVGGIVLVWMGAGLARSVWLGKLSLARQDPAAAAVPAINDVRTGILVSVSNPYWILWWATVGAAYVVMALAYGALGLAVLFIGHIMSDLTWNSLLAFAASSGRRVASDRIYRVAMFGCGLFLVIMGLAFAWAGVGFLGKLAG
jgi:threonine/homoserine/homoserine lactone efflux protein